MIFISFRAQSVAWSQRQQRPTRVGKNTAIGAIARHRGPTLYATVQKVVRIAVCSRTATVSPCQIMPSRSLHGGVLRFKENPDVLLAVTEELADPVMILFFFVRTKCHQLGQLSLDTLITRRPNHHFTCVGFLADDRLAA